MVLLLTVYCKADLALFRRPDLEKDKNKEQSSPENYYSPRRNAESYRGETDFDLYIGGETGKLRNQTGFSTV